MKLRLLTLLLLSPLTAFAASKNGVDATLHAQLTPQDGVLRLAPVDEAKLDAEDALLDGKPGIPLRYGVVQAVAGVSVGAKDSAAGTWTTLADGRLKWQLDVVSDGATSLEFAFTALRLPAGAELLLHALDAKQMVGPITDADNRVDGRYHSVMLSGARARLELVLPADKREHLVLTLGKVVHGYRDPFEAEARRKSGSCNIDVACPVGEPWRDPVASVAHYSFQSGSSSFVCTGQLMATGNRAQDLAQPRFSTAHHCVSTAAEAQSMVFYWGYESPTCREPGSSASGSSLPRAANTRATQNGATLLATDEGTDFTALQLSTAIPAAARAYYSGWDRSGTAPNGSVGIHHPAGHEKRITFNDDPLTVQNNCIVAGATAPTHWRIEQYEAGTTEGGSSGSGLWDPSSQLLVGVLSGGDASCANPGGYDCYGRLSQAWEAGSTAATRMRDAFDRSGTNPQTMAGMAVCDAPSVTLESAAFASAPAAGANVTFSANASGGAAGARTYFWDVDGDGNDDRSGSASSITVAYPSAQQTQVRVRVVDNTGCAGIASRALDIAGPVLDATAAAPQQVCGDNDAAIEPGERWKIPVTLRNTGAVALPAGARALFAPGAASSGVLPIGPNAAGYRATTSALGGCGYSFIDIASGANSVTPLVTGVGNGNAFGPLDDARTTVIALGGGGVPLYGQNYTQAVMSTNGYVSFSATESGGDFSNTCGDGYDNGASGPQLRVHHDDLVVSNATGAGLRYRYFASCPRAAEADAATAQGCHVFQWSRMQIYSDGGAAQGDFEFQAVVYERSGQVSYQYRSAAPDAGAGATIGINNVPGTDPLNASCDADNAAPAQSAVCIFSPGALPSVDSGLRIESATLAVSALAPSQQTTVDVPFALSPGASCGAPLVVDYIATATGSSFSLDTGAVLNTSVGGGGACQATSACPAVVPTINARPGFYFSPARPGNGLANFIYGDVFGGVWYTAQADRRPTWYILNGDYADNLGVMPITRFRNTGAPGGFSPDEGETVGRAWIAQIDADSVMQAWTLEDGRAGAELLDASPQAFPNPNHTQTWYATSESGWGLSIESLLLSPNSFLEFIVGYIYDASGDARWVLGTSSSLTGGSVDLVTYAVHCPACAWFPDYETTAQPAGTLSRSYTGPQTATFDSAITLPAPLSGSWNRSNLPITTIGTPAAPGAQR